LSIQVLRETHDTPEYVTERLIRVGGLNRFNEPIYRAIWGWNRLTPIGGKWEDNGRVEVRTEPKYPQLNRWHVEKWCPPEMYGSPAQWELTTREEGVLALGPYPSRGDYEHVMVIEGFRGEFIQLTSTVAEHIARRIEWSRRNWNGRTERRRLYDREARNDKEYDRWAEMMMDDNPTWVYTPHIYLPAALKEKIA